MPSSTTLDGSLLKPLMVTRPRIFKHGCKKFKIYPTLDHGCITANKPSMVQNCVELNTSRLRMKGFAIFSPKAQWSTPPPRFSESKQSCTKKKSTTNWLEVQGIHLTKMPRHTASSIFTCRAWLLLTTPLLKTAALKLSRECTKRYCQWTTKDALPNTL